MQDEIRAQATDLVQQAAQDGIDVLAVGGVIIGSNGLLLVRRAEAEEVFPNHWEIPGGSVDNGEDLLTALTREIQEETGLETRQIQKFLNTMDFQLADGRTVRQFNFLVEPTHYGVTLNPLEHSAMEWLPIHEGHRLHDMQMSEKMRKTILEFLPKL